MSYIKPKMVTSPKSSLSKIVKVHRDEGAGEWSLAELEWDNYIRLGVRWNGDSNNPIGNPQSRGISTWFILPDEIAEAVKEKLKL
ncbi:MAG: hypothetical protein HY884_05750 [Deltaproteobacteria bacterium]|nr:hypothetical protein [Deltaproteobacteria bacterium]